eukprot:CAMPEP_0202712262 /NCGR_PEP_ID=MMETSP1385-20130828/36151_1 /ASSEMBLY_ACC=CAM_ASM_000861 /TAXON_ID=933848 /ORGANISM="Elphidium margaritaceum" /LENGTH=526 /DNA_ID=CAMNT_0049372233 /DNA_START=51 /DNA_END=1631 /DNA_ORIENTATION=+
MAKQHSLRMDNLEIDDLSIDTDISSLSGPGGIQFDLLTIPQFNVTYISRCLSVAERLTVLACTHRRFYEFILQPQCFPDMSFFPQENSSLHAPKIMSTNLNNGGMGITYVQINIWSKHPFVQRVALLAGMWNFKADLWNMMKWPTPLNIESLQLTLDYTSCASSIHLDKLPHHDDANNNANNSNNDDDEDNESSQSRSRTQSQSDSESEDKLNQAIVNSMQRLSLNQPPFIACYDQDNTNNAADADHKTTTTMTTMDAMSPPFSFDACVSPTTGKPMDLRGRLRNLFFIKYDTSYHQPIIYFPTTLRGLGLQSFTASLFSQKWWIQQIQFEQRLESLRFLVLSCCEFGENELQMLLGNVPHIEHLSLRYIRWEGMLQFPPSLLSLGFFPERSFVADYSLRLCTKLWQITTRFNENDEMSIAFVNACRALSSIQRVKFEHIRHQQYSEPDVNFESLQCWKHKKNDATFTVAMVEEECDNYPILKEIFPIPVQNFINLAHTRFQDCPLWSEESMEFIHMTDKRKLLLR